MTIQQKFAQLRAEEKEANLVKPIDVRSGCKVSWAIYEREEDARAKSKFAIREAELCEELGYDFGYMTPGDVRQLSNGHWEVVLP